MSAVVQKPPSFPSSSAARRLPPPASSTRSTTTTSATPTTTSRRLNAPPADTISPTEPRRAARAPPPPATASKRDSTVALTAVRAGNAPLAGPATRKVSGKQAQATPFAEEGVQTVVRPSRTLVSKAAAASEAAGTGSSRGPVASSSRAVSSLPVSRALSASMSAVAPPPSRPGRPPPASTPARSSKLASSSTVPDSPSATPRPKPPPSVAAAKPTLAGVGTPRTLRSKRSASTVASSSAGATPRKDASTATRTSSRRTSSSAASSRASDKSPAPSRPPPLPSIPATSTRAPPLKRSSSIPISASTRMVKKGSGTSIVSIEEKEEADGGARTTKSSGDSDVGMLTARLAPMASGRTATRDRTKETDEAATATQHVDPDESDQLPFDTLKASVASSNRRESCETLPPSSRPSLAPDAPTIAILQPPADDDGDRHNGETSSLEEHVGDISWETVESRCTSALPSISYQTPQKPSTTDTGALPSRSDMSYISPDVTTLRTALNALHLSASPSTHPTDPRLASLSPPEITARNRGRDSTTLEEILKMSLLSARRSGGEDDDEGWLVDEGVSQIMRKDLEGQNTPLRQSLVQRETEEEARMRVELYEARQKHEELQRALAAIQTAEATRSFEQAEKHQREVEELKEESLRADARVEQQRVAHEEERTRLETSLAAALAAPSTLPKLPPTLLLDTPLLRAQATYSTVAASFNSIVDTAKDQREDIASQLELLAMLRDGLGVWESLLDDWQGV